MPELYKTFDIPTGQDEADIPLIFKKFIDSGIVKGAIIAHFDTLAAANTQIANFPAGSFGWVQAVLCRSNGVSFEPVITPSMGYYQRFLSKADRDAFYSASGAGGVPVAGQIAQVGATGQVYQTMFDGVAWQDTSDLPTRNHELIGTNTGGGQVRLGLVDGRRVDGWAVGVNGNMFIDGVVSASTDLQVARNLTVSGTATLASISTNGLTTGGKIQCWELATWHISSPDGTIRLLNNLEARAAVTMLSNLEVKGQIVGRNGAWIEQTSVFTNTVCGSSRAQQDSYFEKNLGVTGTVFANGFWNTSDERLKQNVADSPGGALAIVDAVPVKTFTMKETGITSTYGWLAQEVMEKLPTAVGAALGDPFAENQIDNPLAVDVTEMTATLWAAVRELSAEVKDLREQLASR